MIRNDVIDLAPPEEPHPEHAEFWGTGPNLTGYPGGYPNGFLEAVRAAGYWGLRRLHLCSGSVHDGVSIDIARSVRPTIRANLDHGVPIRDDVFDLVLLDPPYNERYAREFYGQPLLNVAKLLAEAVRVCRPGGWVGILDFRVWTAVMGHLPVTWVGLHPVYTAARANPMLRAFSVYRKNGGRRLESWSDSR